MTDKRRLIDFFKKNWIGLFGGTIGLIGVIATLYIYNSTKIYREPIFVIDKARSYLIDADQLSKTPLIVIDAYGNQITSNLTAFRFYFWNNGNQPIKEEHILNDIIIVNEDTSSEIIEWKFLNISRDVTKLTLDGYSRNKVQINFSILEQNDGGTGQIIYEGDPNAKIYITGIIEGVKNIKSYIPIPYTTVFRRFGIILVILSVIMALSIGIIYIFEYFIKVSKNSLKKFSWILNLISILLMAIFITTLFKDVRKSGEENMSNYVPENIKPNIEFKK